MSPRGRSGVWLIAASLVASGCGDTRGPRDAGVVVYVSADEALARQVLHAFEEDTGIQVRMVGDTEAFKSTGLAQRIRGEFDRPGADVFWSSEVAQIAMLAEEGHLAPVMTAVTSAWPRAWRDEDHRWHGFSPRPRVIVWDPDRIADVDVPDSWHALLQEAPEGTVAMADPRFGTTGGHLASIRQWCADGGRPEHWADLLEALARGAVQVRSGGNAATVDAVVRGEVRFGMTDMDDVLAARDRGHEVAMALLRHDDEDGGGPMLTPNAVARVHGGPNPRAAEALVDWLLQPGTARLLAASASANMPLDPAVQAEYPELVVTDWLRVDHGEAALGWRATMDEVLAALREAS